MANESSQTFHVEDDDLDDFPIHGSSRIYIAILFSIILFICFFFIVYARCIRRSRSSSSTSTSRTSQPSTQPQGLDAATIKSLPITIHQHGSSEANGTSECSICLVFFDAGDKVKVLPSCSHCYHCDCVDKWFITHSSCPICRTSVRVNSPV